jgi:hypothetical protein
VLDHVSLVTDEVLLGVVGVLLLLPHAATARIRLTNQGEREERRRNIGALMGA